MLTRIPNLKFNFNRPLTSFAGAFYSLLFHNAFLLSESIGSKILPDLVRTVHWLMDSLVIGFLVLLDCTKEIPNLLLMLATDSLLRMILKAQEDLILIGGPCCSLDQDGRVIARYGDGTVVLSRASGSRCSQSTSSLLWTDLWFSIQLQKEFLVKQSSGEVIRLLQVWLV